MRLSYKCDTPSKTIQLQILHIKLTNATVNNDTFRLKYLCRWHNYIL